MFVVISKFTVDEQGGMTASVKNAFAARPHRVENAPGFVRLDVLSPLDHPNEILLLTYWESQTRFQEWYRTHHYHEAHSSMPAGLRLIGDGAELHFFEHISS